MEEKKSGRWLDAKMILDRGDDETREGEQREDPDIETLKLGVPITGKTKEEVLGSIIDLYLQLRMDGYIVHTIYFRSRSRVRQQRHQSLDAFSGHSTKHNVRTGPKRMVGEVKPMVWRALHAAEMEVKWWPMAMRFCMETERMRRRGENTKRIPAFGEKVVVRKRIWRTKLLEPTHEESRYLTPVLDAHGHCVLRNDGRWGIAPYVIKGVKKPEIDSEQVWIGFLEEADRDEMRGRRRIRGKQPVRLVEGEEKVRLRRLLREGSEGFEVDELNNSQMMFKKLEPLKKMKKKTEQEEQEILQTKIMSPQEMVRDIHLWDEFIKSEMRSLLEERKALKLLTAKEENERSASLLVEMSSRRRRKRISLHQEVMRRESMWP